MNSKRLPAAFRRPTSAELVSERKERLHRAYEEAASDDNDQAEMAEIDRAFDAAVADGPGTI